MTLEKDAGGKTELVAMVQQGTDSQSINTHCDHTVSRYMWNRTTVQLGSGDCTHGEHSYYYFTSSTLD